MAQVSQMKVASLTFLVIKALNNKLLDRITPSTSEDLLTLIKQLLKSRFMQLVSCLFLVPDICCQFEKQECLSCCDQFSTGFCSSIGVCLRDKTQFE